MTTTPPEQIDPTSTSETEVPYPDKRTGRFRRRAMKPISATPTLLTLANLVCGFAAIHFASSPVDTSSIFQWSTLTVAGSLIFLGMFFDAIDGSVARLTRSTSDLGAQLDSLCDMVTFGVAPAYLMLRLVGYYYVGPGADAPPMEAFLGPDGDSLYGKTVWAISAFYICCAALRLARFNAEVDSAEESDHRYFRGLPTPGAAGVIASLIILHQHFLFTNTGASDSIAIARLSALAFPFLTLVCGLAMVSSIPYPHVVNQYLRRQRDFGSLLRVVLPIVAAIWFLQATLAFVCTTYAFSGPVKILILKFRRRSHSTVNTGAVPREHQD